MRLLLVDNDSDTLLELRELCDQLGHNVTTVHCTQLPAISMEAYDLAVVSGGYWYDDELRHLETYRAELALIRAAAKPLIGICLGMQLMHIAFSGHVPLLADTQTGAKTINVTNEGQDILGLPAQITVHKNHTRGIITALPHFQILGLSDGNLEMMRHVELPLIGVQFHPEIGDRETNLELMRKLISAVNR